MLVIKGIDDLLARAGQELGVSDPHTVSQADVDTFARVTNDHQWIHVDVDRAKRSTFNGTIAHGFLTLSLLSGLHDSVFQIRGITHGLNYGLDRVRFPAPVPVGSSVHAKVLLAQVDEVTGGAQAKLVSTVECNAAEKPVCVAEFLIRVYGPRSEN